MITATQLRQWLNEYEREQISFSRLLELVNEKFIPITEDSKPDEGHKKKAHPAAKCKKAKCLVCSSAKVLNIPDRQTKRENSKQHNHENNKR